MRKHAKDRFHFYPLSLSPHYRLPPIFNFFYPKSTSPTTSTRSFPTSVHLRFPNAFPPAAPVCRLVPLLRKVSKLWLDLLIMPSTQPQNQIPIYASTGGLVDTVKEGFTGFQMGDFNVKCAKVDPADVLKIVVAVGRALAVYGTLAFREMIKNCMSRDLLWKGPVKNWELMLMSLGAAKSEPGLKGRKLLHSPRKTLPHHDGFEVPCNSSPGSTK